MPCLVEPIGVPCISILAKIFVFEVVRSYDELVDHSNDKTIVRVCEFERIILLQEMLCV